MLKDLDDKKVLLGCIVGSVVAYNGIRYVRKLIREREREGPLIPIGVIKTLYIYPIKSCKGQSVFALFCGKEGAQSGEMRDRYFLIVNGNTGVFYTGRQKPQMVRIDVTVIDGYLTMKLDDGKSVKVNLEEVRKRRDVRQNFLFQNQRTDGLDCGDEVSKLLSAFLEEDNVRCMMYNDALFNERICKTEDFWWNNNPVPKREDYVAYPDLAPYMIATEASLADLNTKLDDKVTQRHFRPVIVVDKCAAWDEDKWSHLQFGDVKMTCFKPCDRCVMTTIDPETGKKDPENQPLKKLREFRLAPEGTPMRKDCRDSPLYGVFAGVDQPVTQLNFRPVIVVDKCAAWDEDKWLHLQMGDVKMTCYKPCTRCILTTVNPETGKKHPDMQPIRELRKFRLAPEGTPMREEFKDSPIFGVNAGVEKEGYIHVGQVVYARYKKNGAF